jgi:hypothetical protein
MNRDRGNSDANHGIRWNVFCPIPKRSMANRKLDNMTNKSVDIAAKIRD